MPELGINLISQGELNKETYTILSYNSIIIKQGSKIITKGKKLQNLYYLPIKVITNKEQVLTTGSNTSSNTSSDTTTNTSSDTTTNTSSDTTTNTSSDNTTNYIWHQRLGHINNEALNKLKTSTIGYNTSNTNSLKDINKYEACLKAKFANKINHKTNNKNKLSYLDKVASDLCGPINPPTYNKYKYIITFLDKATRYLEV